MAANTRSTRRKREAAASGATSSSKLRSPGICWEWEADGSLWTAFTGDHNTAVNDAFINDSPHVDLHISRGTKVRVAFSSMIQINLKTGWQRDVRCVSQSSSYEYSDFWQWQPNGKTSWEMHPSAVGRLIEAAQVVGKPSQTISLQGSLHEVDLLGMTQKPCDGRTSQPIRRLSLDHVPQWEWQNEYGIWVKYPRILSQEFESGRDDGSTSCLFGIAGRQYYLYLDRMEQENKETKVVRKVRRIAPVPVSGQTSLTGQDSNQGTDESGPSGSGPSGSGPSGSGPSGSGPSGNDPSGSGPSGNMATMDTTPGPSNSSSSAKPKPNLKQGSAGAVVDPKCTAKLTKAHVYVEDDDVWDAMLNQTNYRNNNNKFYVIQLLEDNSSKAYSVWMRWGRVGLTGQSKLENYGGDLQGAKNAFEKKFQDKTKNSWSERDSFQKQEGKYDLLQMDRTIQIEEDEKEEVDIGDVPEPVSKLDPRLQALIELICDIKAMEEAVVEMKYDAQKAPLGKLTKDQIKAGYVTLKRIEDCIQKGSFGDDLVKACDEFYTRIPHSFGMQRPPLIRTSGDVKQKLQLLQALGDIEIAMKVLSAKRDRLEHPIDQHYKELHCSLEPLDHSHNDFKMVEKYVTQTHGKTHSNYKLKVVDVFTVDREMERQNFKDLGNRMLLWHGSRLSNWVGILRQGLRIAPPEAPVTGYMFGKGVYFADMCSKSANYCFATKKNMDGILLLCDVSLGSTNDLLAADYNAHKLPKGKHSTKGLGRTEPDPSQNIITADNCTVPCGTSVNTGVSNPKGYTLQYNEYIVYDTKQIMMKYLVQVKFSF